MRTGACGVAMREDYEVNEGGCRWVKFVALCEEP